MRPPVADEFGHEEMKLLIQTQEIHLIPDARSLPIEDVSQLLDLFISCILSKPLDDM